VVDDDYCGRTADCCTRYSTVDFHCTGIADEFVADRTDGCTVELIDNRVVVDCNNRFLWLPNTYLTL